MTSKTGDGGRRKSAPMSPDDPRHGRLTSYKTRGCRCEPCTAANTLYQKRYMMRHYKGERLLVDATGTRRRIQSLVAIGWTLQEIAVACGRKNKEWPREVMKSTVVHERTAMLLEAAYERMSMTVPVGKYRARQRSIARRNGWVPPLAWDDIDTDASPRLDGERVELDEVTVDRLLAGQRMHSTPAEKTEALRRWTADGKSAASLCRLHGWKEGRYAVEEVAA